VIDRPDWIARLKDWKCTGVEDIEKKYEVITEKKGEKPVYRMREKE